jgi:hypothetical protein
MIGFDGHAGKEWAGDRSCGDSPMTRIAVAQVALAVGDPEADAAAAERAITAAAGAGADLVVLPELGEQRIRVP